MRVLAHFRQAGWRFSRNAAIPSRPSSDARSAAMRKFKFLKSADVVILENAGNAYLMAV